LQRQSDEEITIVDLTGVAFQDIQIVRAVSKEASGRLLYFLL
jgi:ornithine cyclodeaminase/alanine dehydrogenase-like protein (mu-crystallin family)